MFVIAENIMKRPVYVSSHCNDGY